MIEEMPQVRTSDVPEHRYSFEIEVRDGWGNLLGVVGDHLSADISFSALADDVEASTIELPGSSSWARTFMRANRRVTLVHVLVFRGTKQVKLWTGRVDRAVRKGSGPQSQISVELISDKAYFNHIVNHSAPFMSISIQAPKIRLKVGGSVHIMKQFISDNLLRIQSTQNSIWKISKSTWMEDKAQWGSIQNHMWPITVLPTKHSEDTSPTSALQVQMTPTAELIAEACKDNNLLATATFLVPGRDQPDPRVALLRPGIFIDIIDKDKDRSRKAAPNVFNRVIEAGSVFLRGIFGRYDVPSEPQMQTAEGLRQYFGRQDDDPWVIFRSSDEHWSEIEVASYAPTATRSISGGRSPEFLNKGITLVANYLITAALAAIGLGFIAGLAGLLTGKLSDVLLAYQDADDQNMRDFLGPFAFPEEFVGAGTTAYSLESSQQLRSARWGAIGYQTATFTGDSASFRPFRAFEDFDLLDPVAWEYEDEDRLIPERVKMITMTETREGVTIEVRIGEAERPEEPWAAQTRRNSMFSQAINQALSLD